MTRYVHDEEASLELHIDVVHEMVERKPGSPTQWIEAMQRLNSIKDPLIRKILAVHLDCGSGTGVCDGLETQAIPVLERANWGCDTTEIIADHYRVEFPACSETD